MLILSRKSGEGVLITDGEANIFVYILKSATGRVSIGVEAPGLYKVIRVDMPLEKPH